MKAIHTPAQTDLQKASVPAQPAVQKIKLSILLYDDKPDNAAQVMAKMDMKIKLQDQLNAINSNEIDVIFRFNEHETVQEKKNWLLSETTSKKYVFLTGDTVIEDNFLVLRLNAVRLRKPTKVQVDLGIYAK
jgi:hypothetical protein